MRQAPKAGAYGRILPWNDTSGFLVPGICAGFEFIDDARFSFHRRGRSGARWRRRWRAYGSGALGGVFLFDDLEAVEKDFGPRRSFQLFIVFLVALAGSVGLGEGVAVIPSL